MKLEDERVGNATGLIPPKELLNKLNLAQGDWLHVTENTDGRFGCRLTTRLSRTA